MINCISDIHHVLYINLESRPDRREQVVEQLAMIGLGDVSERFNAVKLPSGDGRIGCSMSHLKCLQLAKKNGWDHVLICEDDILFLDPDKFIENLNGFLACTRQDEWDVILLAGNNVPPYFQTNEYSIRVQRCQTTTGYIVQSHYYDTLIENIREGISKLIENPSNHFQWAIDKNWIKLQKQGNWFLITPPTVVQREGFSDIEQKHTNYQNLMTDLNKAHFFKPNV